VFLTDIYPGWTLRQSTGLVLQGLRVLGERRCGGRGENNRDHTVGSRQLCRGSMGHVQQKGSRGGGRDTLLSSDHSQPPQLRDHRPA
jgi:hypothetical protein